MKIDSRFYWNRLQDLFVTCNSVGLRYTKAQIIDLLDSHASIMQHDNVVVRELGIKSFTQIL